MSKNLGAKPMLVPQPVMMIGTYDADGNANVMNAAWGGIVGANEIIKLNKAFTVAIADAEHVAACDYVGIVSANDEPDKMKKAGFTTRKSEFVNAPVINELSLTMECKLKEIIDGDKFLGEIVNVVADDRILGDDGEITYEEFHPIVFDTIGHGYFALGDRVGDAFSEGNKLK